MASTGTLIQSHREALGISRNDLAHKLGITRLKVWRIETGQTQLPADEIGRWAVALGIKAADLVSEIVS